MQVGKRFVTNKGILHMFKRDNKVIKVLWVACFLISAGWMVYMIYQTVSLFLKWETVIKTESILEIPTKFPTVSFCSINPFYTPLSIGLVETILAENNLTMQNFYDIHLSYIMLQFKYA